MPPCQDAGQDSPHKGLKKAEIPFSHLFGDIFNIHLCKMPDHAYHILTAVHAVYYFYNQQMTNHLLQLPASEILNLL